MTPPRTPYDEELERYVRGSKPPPALESVRQQVAARLETPTGIHYLEELQRQLQAQAIAAVKDKIEAEKRRADKAEALIRGFWKWCASVLASLLAALIAAVIIRKAFHP